MFGSTFTGHDGEPEDYITWEQRTMTTPNTAANGGQILTEERTPDSYSCAKQAANPNSPTSACHEYCGNMTACFSSRYNPEKVAAQHDRIRAEERAGRTVFAEECALLAAVPASEPVAWLHDVDGRVDVIHDEVKQLWLKVAPPNGFYREKVPCKVEHYTIPLYAAAPAPVSGMPDSRSLHVAMADEPQVDERCRYFWRAGWNACRYALPALPSPQAPDTTNPTGETK